MKIEQMQTPGNDTYIENVNNLVIKDYLKDHILKFISNAITTEITESSVVNAMLPLFRDLIHPQSSKALIGDALHTLLIENKISLNPNCILSLISKEEIIYKLDDEDQILIKNIKEYFKNTSGFELNNDQAMKHVLKRIQNQFQMHGALYPPFNQNFQGQMKRWSNPVPPQYHGNNFSQPFSKK